MAKMLDEYYNLRGWDPETSLPTRTKLEELELKEVQQELAKLGKLKK